MKTIAGVLAAAVFTALGHAAHATEARYHCKDGSRLAATFANDAGAPGSVVLAFGGGDRVTLPQVLSADGGRYADKDIEFWIKGNAATLTRSGKATTCSTKP